MRGVTYLLEADLFKGEPINVTVFKQVVNSSRRARILSKVPSHTRTRLASFYQEYDDYLPGKLSTFTQDVKDLIQTHMDSILAAQNVVAEDTRLKQAALKRAQEDEDERHAAELIARGRDLQRRNIRATTVNTQNQCAPAAEAALQALQASPPDIQRAIVSLEDLLEYFRR